MAEPARESAAWREYWALIQSPVFRGRGVPRGDGRMVLIIPGLFGNDFYLQSLHGWLNRIGYRTAFSTLSFNAGCPKRVAARVEGSVRAQLEDYEGDVAIIGHSRGGMLGKAIQTRLGERCTHLIALGSPLGGALRHGRRALVPPSWDNEAALTAGELGTAVANAGRQLITAIDPDCDIPECNCEYVRDLLAPLPPGLKVTAIFSSQDPVVPPQACRIDGAANHEITGTHTGLVFNKQAYPLIAEALAG